MKHMNLKKLMLTLVMMCVSVGITWAQTSVTIGQGISTSNIVPFDNNYRYSTTESIYTLEEIGGGGTITSISYYVSNASSYSASINIYMGHKSQQTFSGTSDYMNPAELTLVFSGSGDLGGTTGWVKYNFTTPFYFNGMDNLVVVVCKTGTSFTDALKYRSSEGSTLYRQSDSYTSYSDVSNTSVAFTALDQRADVMFDVSNDNTISQDNIVYYLYDNGEATILDGKVATGDVVVPTSVKKNDVSYQVNKISKSAFANNTSITSISIPSSVSSIPCGAFSGCSNLKSITLPSISSNTLGYIFGTFSYEGGKATTQNSTTYYIPTNLKSVTINGGTINSYAFEDCSGLTSVTIGDSVTSIGQSAFRFCSGLTSVTIGNSVTSIGSSAFYGCSGLTSVTIPNSITSIGSYALYNCSGLTSVTIPNSVTSIGSYAFSGCSNLRKVYNESSLSITKGSQDNGYVGYYANAVFSNVASVEDEGDYYFYTDKNGKAYLSEYVGSDTELELPEKYNEANYEIAYYAFYNCNQLTSVDIPSSVTSIGNSAFYKCSGLTSITIPNSVTSIGSYAFRDCNELTSVTIGNSVTSIGSCAFYDCSDLTSVTIGNSVTSIGSDAFRNCSGLTSVTIGNSVISIGSDAFYNCSNLKKVYNGSSLSITTGSSNNGYVGYYANAVFSNVASVEVTGDYCFYTNKDGKAYLSEYVGSETELELPDKYNEADYGIADYAFYNCNQLTSIDIPSSVTSIGSYAFFSCSGLTSVTIPGFVTNIESYAFYNCSGLSSATIGNSVTSIGLYAFQNCSGLTSITIPNSVINIDNFAFKGCSGIKELIFEKGDTELNLGYNSYGYPGNGLFYDCPIETLYLGRDLKYSTSSNYGYSPFYNKSSLHTITLENGVTSISSYCFYGCTNIKSIAIPNSVTSIGQYAFSGCDNLVNLAYNAKNATVCQSNGSNRSFPTTLKTIVIGDDVESIPAYFVSGNTGLISITIPNSVTSIGEYAYYGCSNLKTLSIPKSVKTIGTYAFYDCPLRSVTYGTGLLTIGSKAFNNVTKAIWLTNTPPTGYNGVSSKINFVANDQYTSLSNKKQYNFLSSAFTVNGIKYVPTSLSGRTCDVIDCEYTNAAQNVTINSTVTYRNVAFKVENMNDYACYDNDSIQSLAIGEDVAAIGNYSFYGCDNLTTATLKEGTPSIGNYAFSGCTKLGAMAIPNSVTSIGTYAFENCTSMTSATIGTGITTLPTYLFSGCSALPAITIPNNVTTINNYAFTGCTALGDVLIDNRETALTLGSNGSSPLFASCALDSVYIGGKISYQTSSSYGYSPFYRNTTLRSIVIADSETNIYTNEFYGCTGLKNVTIGDGVTAIGDWAFSGCSSLDHFIFGTALETIGKEAFSDCTAMTEITTRRTTPPTCGSQALDDIDKWSCTLRIPTESVEQYTAADQWMEFLFTEGLSADVHTLTFNIDGNLYELDYHSQGSVIIPPTAPDREGYTFNGWEDLPSYMPDENLVINGSYTVNKYKLTYYLDGALYKESEIDYGTEISALADPTKDGWYYFSGWNEVPETMPANDVNVYGTMNPYTMGDVNSDQEITVSDAVGICNLILNTNTDGLIRAAADLNEDKTVSVADMIYECNVILGNNTITPPTKARRKINAEASEESAWLEANDVEITKQGENALYISLQNPNDEITGLQFDLHLPEGIMIAEKDDEYDGRVSDITLAGRTNYMNHALSSAVQQDGSVRILLSSNELKTINGTEGALIKIRLIADEYALQYGNEITIDNIEMGKTDNSYIHQDTINANAVVGEATSVQRVEGDGDDSIYDLSGRKLTGKTHGINIVNGRKVLNK